MVLHKYGDKLYQGLKDVVDTHLKEVAESVSGANDDNFLVSLQQAWQDHTQSMLMIRDILMYMVRLPHPSRPPFALPSFQFSPILID